MTAEGDSLRLLFDAYWWVSGPPSGRNVLRSVVTTWNRQWPSDRLTLLVRSDELGRVRADLAKRGITAALRAAPSLARVHALAARSAGARGDDHDAVITQNFATRTRSAISGVLVHDAMYVDHPEWFTRAERAYLAWLRPSLRAADVIFTTSRAETERVGRVWPETRSRLHRVGLDVPVDLAAAPPRRPRRVGAEERFILSVGRLNVRKNVGRLIEAFLADAGLRDRFRLLIVGSPDGVREQLAADARERVVFLDHVDDAELRWLYENAALFVMPSLDEGFGLPLVEARAAGTPSLASDLPVFREVGADGYFDPHSTDDLRRALVAASDLPRRSDPPAATEWTEVVDRMRSGLVERVHGRREHVPAA